MSAAMISVTRRRPMRDHDIGREEDHVNVGIGKGIAEFAVNGIRSWQTIMGSNSYPDAGSVMIAADCVGSNGRSNILWKTGVTNGS